MKKRKITLALILILAAVFRFTGLNWDEGAHLHPDERYLTMAATAVSFPETLGEYFDPQVSSLSPYNSGYGAYIYGLFPLNWVKLWAVGLGMDDYNSLTLLGRVWSVVFSLMSVVLVYFLGKKVFSIRAGLLAALLTAINVLFIQSAHFWTMESFLVFFVLLTFLFCLRILERGKLSDFLFAGVSLGLALACKLNAVFLLGIVGLAALLNVTSNRSNKSNRTSKSAKVLSELWQVTGKLAAFGLIAYIVFRAFNPYIFKNPSFLDLSLREDFLSAFRFQLKVMSKRVWFPPQYQWVGTIPYWFPLKNLALWGLGLPTFVLTVGGLVLAVVGNRTDKVGAVCVPELTNSSLLSLNKRLKSVSPAGEPSRPVGERSGSAGGVVLILFWVVGIFLYQGRSFVKSMRYLIPTLPFMLLFGGYFVERVISLVRRRSRVVSVVTVIMFSYFLLGSLIYSLAFVSIYTRPTTRVAASEWIYNNVPENSIIVNEHWDDSLPITVDRIVSLRKDYVGRVLEVYDPDGDAKIAHLNQTLTDADYIIISSSRASGSIGQLPEDFPVMSRYYQLLFEEKLGFEKVAEFTSYPQLFGIVLNDDNAEESFTIFDHPKVVIFEKESDVDIDVADVLKG